MNDSSVCPISCGMKSGPAEKANCAGVFEGLTRSMGMICVILALVIAAPLPAATQESQSEELERIDVDRPERRAQPRRERPAYREPAPPPIDLTDDYPYTQPEPDLYSSPMMSSLGPVMNKMSVSSVGAGSLPAQVDVVTKQDIDRLDARTYIDLFKKVPGLRVYSYDAGEIGHPFQMRGFAGSHGSDVAVYVDGVPQNLPSSVIAMNGASDVSWLAPEMIEKIEVIKGPFSAFYGNQAQAGAINIITKNSEPSSSLTVSGATFNGFRALPIISTESFAPIPFLAYEYQTVDGYRDNSQYRRLSLFNKLTQPICGGAVSFRFNYYKSNFGVPGMLSINDVRSGIKRRLSCVDPSDGGSQRTWSLVLNYSPVGQGAGLYLDAYLENTMRERFQTWVPYGQTWSSDERVFYGGRAYYNFVFGNFASVILGGEVRWDSGEVYEWSTENRRPVTPQNDYGLYLQNHSLFVQAEFRPADILKIVGGARKEYITNKIDNQLNPANSGTGRPHTFNPKVGFVLTPLKNLNIFGNKGVGFRAPGASDMSPVDGSPAFDIDVAKTETWDLGFNAILLDKFYVSANWYQTDMEKELRTIDNKATNIGDSQRNGFEMEARCYASPQVDFFANYSWVEAEVKNPTTPGQTEVTGMPEHLIKAGIGLNYALTPSAKFVGDLYAEYVSEQPLYVGKSPEVVYSPDYVSYHMKGAWQGQHWGIFMAALYQPKEYSSNNWLGFMDGKMSFTPQPLWDFKGGLKYTF